MQRLRPTRVAKLAATVACRSADAHSVDYSSWLLAKGRRSKQVILRIHRKADMSRLESLVACRNPWAGLLLLDDRNTRCVYLEIRSQTCFQTKSFIWLEVWMLCGMLRVPRPGCSWAPEDILYVALAGCKRFYHHMARFFPFQRERINVVNIFSFFFKIKVMKIIVLTNKCTRRDTRTLTVSVAAIAAESIFKGIYIFLHSWSYPDESIVHCAATATRQQSTLCFTNKKACEPSRPAVGTRGKRNWSRHQWICAQRPETFFPWET